MTTALHQPAVAAAIAAVGTARFSPALMAFIETLIRFDCAVILGCPERKHPIYLYDSLLQQRQVLFERYLTAAFEQDPFYLTLMQHKQQGVFNLKQVIHSDALYREYCREFYHLTGWQDELAIVIEVAPARWVIIYLGLTAQAQRFSQDRVAQLLSGFAVIQALCQKHWAQAEFYLAEPVLDPQYYSGRLKPLLTHALATFGQPMLTRREQEVATLLLQGQDSKAIAVALGISEGTVKNHRKRIYAQLRVASLSELFQLFLNYLLSQPDA